MIVKQMIVIHVLCLFFLDNMYEELDPMLVQDVLAQ